MKTLPFNFRRLKNNKFVCINYANEYAFLDCKNQVELMCDSPNELPYSVIEHLRNSLFLARPIDYETKMLLTSASMAKRFQKKLTSKRLIMIVPTLRCDHLCSYCQVSRVNIDKKGYDLPLNTISQIIETIIQLESAPYKIEFQGGEPLLRMDFIILFYDEFLKRVDKKKFQVVIATSLSLLTDEFIMWCKGKNIHFSVSVDGKEKVHNMHRNLLNNSSFELAKVNVSKVKRQLGTKYIASVSTITKDAINDLGIIDAHLELDLHDMFVRPVSSYGFAIKNDIKSLNIKDYLAYYEMLIRKVIEKNINGTYLVEHMLRIHYLKVINHFQDSYVDLASPAGYIMGAMIVDYTGNVFGSDEARMLYRKHKIKDVVLGNILKKPLSNVNLKFSQKILQDSFIFDKPGCESCAYQHSCGADPIYHLQTQGESVGNKLHSRFCDLHKGIFDLVFQLIQETDSKRVLDSWVNA